MAEKTEPQNTLTKQFTEAEWAALKELRGKLPEVFAEAYPDAKSTPIIIWGVTLDPNGEPEAKASVVLMKFLRARELNVQVAQEMLTTTLKWRKEFDVEACVKEEFPPEIFGKLGHIYGKDKEGRPVTYNIYGGDQDLKAVFSDTPRFLRWRVAFMEKGIELLDFENIADMLQIHDYEGVSMTSRDAESKRAASEATALFQAHYPEFLHKKYFINVPRIMAWIFWIFKPLMASKTFAKLEVVGTGADTIGKALLPAVDAKELPKRYGGEAEGF